jgi:hypothetical protein
MILVRKPAHWPAGLMTAALVVVGSPAVAQLPNPGMEVDNERTAVVVTDPQNDFLSPDGVTWGVVGESVTENNTVANLDRLMSAAKQQGYELFISPHYYYPTDCSIGRLR